MLDLSLIPNPAVCVDRSGQILGVSPRFVELAGRTAEQWPGASLTEVLPFRQRQAVLERLAGLAERGDQEGFEASLMAADGTERLLAWEAQGRAEAGRVMLSGVDITRRAHSRQGLQERESLFRQMFQQHPAVKFLLDARSGEIADVNAATERFYGYSRYELLGQPITLITQLSADELAGTLRRIASQERSVFHVQHRLKSGELRDVRVETAPVQVGGRLYLYSIVHDVTEQNAYERALEAYKELFDQLPVGVFRTTAGDPGHFQETNPALVAMLGADSAEELAEHTVVELYADTGERQSITGKLQSEGEVVRREVRLRTLDHRTFWAAITGRQRRVEDGELVLEGVVEDISERKAAEAERDDLLEIIEATPDFIGMADAEGRVRYQNPGARRLLTGDEQSPVVQERVADARPDWAVRRLRQEVFPALHRYGVWRGETAFLGPDGHEIPVHQTIIGHFGDDGDLRRISTIARDISDQKAYERHLQQERDYTEAILQSLPGIFYMIDANRRFANWNRRFEELLGMEGEALAHTDPLELFPAEERDYVGARIREVFEQGHSDAEAHLIAAEGEAVPYYFTGYRMLLGDRRYLLGVGLDMSERKAFERELQRLNRLTVGLLENTSDAYIAVDNEWRVRYFNASAESLFRVPRAVVEEADLWDAVPELASFFFRPFRQALHEGESVHMEGVYPPLQLHLDSRFYPAEDGAWAFFRDVSERKRLEAELQRQAAEDRLTGLYNRLRFDELLAQELTGVAREDSLSLLMLDIDHFKSVNDTYGHEVGDQALQAVARVLRGGIRRGDSVARWGGEEFTVLLPGADAQGAAHLAEELRAAVAATPIPDVAGVHVSIGVAELRPGEQEKDLVRRADGALYAAKQAGRNRVVVAD
jgi:diguanylate cyclase (GGDEF)-like protein/PAS domain S-box-containing protein